MRQALKAVGWYLFLVAIWQLLEFIGQWENNRRRLMCGICKYRKYIDYEWVCNNEDSENYGLEVGFDDDCMNCEEKGE